MCYSYAGLATKRAGRPAEAAREFQKAVAIMERLSNLQPGAYDLYNLACFQSLLSGIAAEPGSGLTDADVGRLGEQAVNTLRRAASAGLQAVEHMRKDADLEPLRLRRTFRCCSWISHSPTIHSRSEGRRRLVQSATILAPQR